MFSNQSYSFLLIYDSENKSPIDNIHTHTNKNYVSFDFHLKLPVLARSGIVDIFSIHIQLYLLRLFFFTSFVSYTNAFCLSGYIFACCCCTAEFLLQYIKLFFLFLSINILEKKNFCFCC